MLPSLHTRGHSAWNAFLPSLNDRCSYIQPLSLFVNVPTPFPQSQSHSLYCGPIFLVHMAAFISTIFNVSSSPTPAMFYLPHGQTQRLLFFASLSIIILPRVCLLNFFFLIYFFLAVLGLRCCEQALSSWGERGPIFVAVCRLLIAVASLVEHGL